MAKTPDAHLFTTDYTQESAFSTVLEAPFDGFYLIVIDGRHTTPLSTWPYSIRPADGGRLRTGRFSWQVHAAASTLGNVGIAVMGPTDGRNVIFSASEFPYHEAYVYMNARDKIGISADAGAGGAPYVQEFHYVGPDQRYVPVQRSGCHD